MIRGGGLDNRKSQHLNISYILNIIKMKSLITMRLDDEYLEFLTKRRVNKTSFMRQAIRAHNEGKWGYVHKGRQKK